MTGSPRFIYRCARAAASCSSRSACARAAAADRREDAEALEAEIAGELPAAYCERVTRAKLWLRCQGRRRQAGAHSQPNRRHPLLRCHRALGRQILGKPRDAAHASAICTALSGRTRR